MGLVDCVDCGAKHSDADNTICPQCGRPWGTEEGRRKKAYNDAMDRLNKEKQYAFERELHDPRTDLSELLRKYKPWANTNSQEMGFIEQIEDEIFRRHGEEKAFLRLILIRRNLPFLFWLMIKCGIIWWLYSWFNYDGGREVFLSFFN
jgi:hypothetical protein